MKLSRGWFAAVLLVVCGCTPNTPEPPPTPPPVAPVTPTSNTMPVTPQSTAGQTSTAELIAMLALTDAPQDHPDPANELATHGKAAVPALIEALSHKNWRVRTGAIFALGRIGKDASAAKDQLQTIAKQDENSTVRDAAAFALDAIDE